MNADMNNESMQTAVNDLLELLRIPGVSTEEALVAEHLTKAMLALGVPPDAILRDRAFEGSEYGGQCGNLIVRFPAVEGHRGPIRLFSAHMDTVALAKGAKPRLVGPEDDAGQGGRIVNDAPGAALGGDDRAGCAALLQVARALTGPLAGQPHPPVVLVFTVQEEVGLVGARQLEVALLGLDRPALSVNLDGGNVEEVITKVTGTSRFEIDIEGVASHAGTDPGAGVSAAVVAAKAIASLAQQGWHGPIDRDGGRGSSNVGTMHGGAGTNVVMDRLVIRAEARSHDAIFRNRIREVYEQTFREAAAQTTNRHGQPAKVSFRTGPCYEAFALADDLPVVQALLRAGRRCGMTLRTISNDGGMDANWYHGHGIPTAVLGLGLRKVHTPDEWIDLKQYWDACRVLLEMLNDG
jgi:tripeptide aminopeptidase